MKKFTFYLLVLLTITTLTSCFKGSLKGLYSEYANNKELIDIEFIDKISPKERLDNEKIYAINGSTLKHELKKYDKSLLYIWSPNCHSDVCIPINSVQDYCDENGIELFVILEYYDAKVNDFTLQPTNPIFTIDHIYYKSNLISKYHKQFLKDLLEYESESFVDWHRFLFFKKDEFDKSVQKLF